MSLFDVPLESRIRYLQRRQAELMDLSRALNQELFDLAQKMGHQIKGNAVSFGFPELTEIAEQLEKASLVRAEDQIKMIQKNLMDRVQKYLQQLT